MTSTINEIDITELIDFDTEPPCDGTNYGCSDKVEWKHTRKCCGVFFLYCNTHHENDIHFVRNSLLIHCVICQTKFIMTPIDEMLIITKV